VILVVALPMTATLLAVIALALLGRRLDGELVALRRSLRLVGATAVAADELSRTGDEVAERTLDTTRQARQRLRRPRRGGDQHRR